MKLKSVGMQYRANPNEQSTKPQSSAAVEDVYEMIEGAALSAEYVVDYAKMSCCDIMPYIMRISEISSN